MSVSGTQMNGNANLMRPDRKVGIVGYGAYVPRYRLPGAEVARVWTNGLGGSPIIEKAVAGLDEDVTTMSVEAARNALARAGIDPTLIRAVWVGSESHPMPSNRPAPSSLKASALRPIFRPPTGNLRAKPAPKRSRLRSV